MATVDNRGSDVGGTDAVVGGTDAVGSTDAVTVGADNVGVGGANSGVGVGTNVVDDVQVLAKSFYDDGNCCNIIRAEEVRLNVIEIDFKVSSDGTLPMQDYMKSTLGGKLPFAEARVKCSRTEMSGTLIYTECTIPENHMVFFVYGEAGFSTASVTVTKASEGSFDKVLWGKRMVLLGTVTWAYIDIALDGVNGYKLWEKHDYYWSAFMFSMLFIPNAMTWAFLRANGMATCWDFFVLMSQFGPIRELCYSWEKGQATSAMVWFIVAEGLGEATFTGVLNGYILTFGSDEPLPIVTVPYSQYSFKLPLNTFYIGFLVSLVTITKTALKLNFYGLKSTDYTTLDWLTEFIRRFPGIALRISSLACFGYMMRSTCSDEDDLSTSTQIELPSVMFVSLCTLMSIIYAVEPSVSLSICTYFAATMVFTTPMRFLSCFYRIHDTIANLRILEFIILLALAYNPLDPNPRLEMLFKNADLLCYIVMGSFVGVIVIRFLEIVYGFCLAHGYITWESASAHKTKGSGYGAGRYSLMSDTSGGGGHYEVVETIKDRAKHVKEKLRMAITSEDIMMTSLLVQLEAASLQDPFVVKNVPKVFPEDFQAKLVGMGMPRNGNALKNMGTDATDFKLGGWDLLEIKDLGFGILDLKAAGFSLVNMKEADITPEELHGNGYITEQLIAAGYDEGELKAAGFRPSDEPTIGDEMLCLPGITGFFNGEDYYKEGDKGIVTKNTEVTASDGIERFEVTWHRTGKISTMMIQYWKENFERLRRVQRELLKGDEVEALVEFNDDGTLFYRKGDKGRVTKEKERSEHDGVERIEITWYESGQTTTMKEAVWMQNFKLTDEEDKDAKVVKLKAEIASIRAKLEEKARGPKTVAVMGDEVEVLPGIELVVDGKVYYKPGDRGIVCVNTYVTESDGIKRFECTWFRTGLISTMKTDAWLANFRFIKSGKDTALLGDEMEALPGIELVVDGKVYYKPGDLGKVSKDTSVTESDGIRRFEVGWYRTGLVSTMKTDLWMKNFRYTGNTKGDAVVGDEVQALPGIELIVEGKVYYQPGDMGRVCKNTYVTESDGIKRFEVSWYKTGLTSTMKTEMWLNNFYYTGSSKATPVMGDEVEVLPGVSFSHEGKDYYKAGDKGRVSADAAVTSSDKISRFEVTWYRSGLTSTMKTELWARNFKYIGSQKLPTVGMKVKVMQGVEFSTAGKEYYKEGDVGTVCKDEYKDTDGQMKFEIKWPRTNLTSTMLSHRWAQNFMIDGQ